VLAGGCQIVCVRARLGRILHVVHHDFRSELRS
jgi:hypothetical protein